MGFGTRGLGLRSEGSGFRGFVIRVVGIRVRCSDFEITVKALGLGDLGVRAVQGFATWGSVNFD